MIEDRPREVEFRRLLGIDEQDGPTMDDLVTALEQSVILGKWLTEHHVEIDEWRIHDGLKVEAEKKKPSKSLYAKATDTGVVDSREAARRLDIDWDTAAESPICVIKFRTFASPPLWTPPPSRWVKVDSDVAVREEFSVCAYVGRDNNGLFSLPALHCRSSGLEGRSIADAFEKSPTSHLGV
ncbi:hypothetical protein TorRG33x02_018300 [Trema orientale]|uniref:Uncharacterized protein n=1 Tax=Trema orientale TaxID=63057 RepID=A0A2P5FW74_TREOI|nr:hypothetical protein TorRG33x02_018300 [Trema orientale]